MKKEEVKQLIEEIVDDRVHKFEGLTKLIEYKRADPEEAKSVLTELGNDKKFSDTFDIMVDMLAPYILLGKENEYHKYLIENGQEKFLREDVISKDTEIVDKDDYINKLKNQS